MSYTKVRLMAKNGEAVEIARIANAYAIQPYIWDAVCAAVWGGKSVFKMDENERTAFNSSWTLDGMPLHFRTALLWTFDRTILEPEHFMLMADHLGWLVKDFHPANQVCGLPELIEVLRKAATMPADDELYGMVITTDVQHDFWRGPWSEELADYEDFEFTPDNHNRLFTSYNLVGSMAGTIKPSVFGRYVDPKQWPSNELRPGVVL